MLEIDVMKEIYPDDGQVDALAGDLSLIDVDQFHGIELGEFPVRIAEAALWMMDHIMNNRLSLAFGQTYVRIPLRASPRIRHGDALEIDWTDLLAPEDCSFVFGNPPFAGAKLQTAEQRAQLRRVAALGGSGGTLDYVAAWFIKAGEYVRASKARIGFVATNSITQGEQVAQLWPILFGRCALEIAYAHRTFAWGSDARGKAHVHVVIVGLDQRKSARAKKRLFAYPDINGEPEETRHAALSPYLFDAGGLSDPHLTVREERRPVNGMRKLVIGSKPIDGGHYIFDAPKNGPRCWPPSRVLRPSCALLSARASTCRAPGAGFSPCMTPRPTCWRACRGCANGSPPSARSGRPAKASLRGSWRKRPRSTMSTSCPPRPSSSFPKPARSDASTCPSVGWSRRPVPSNALRVIGRRDAGRFRAADLGHAHGVAAPNRRAAEESTAAIPSASSTTPSRCRLRTLICHGWSRSRKPFSMPGPRTGARRSPISTTATGCRPSWAGRIGISTARWTGSIAAPAFLLNTSVSNACSRSMKRCARHSGPR